MNIKSLLLGSAAALVAVSGARAADAVVIAEPEPVEYVRVCDVYGEGYFYIPGTETCLRVAGRVRFDIQGADAYVLNSDTGWHTRSRAEIYMRSRSETEYGTLGTNATYRFNFDDDGANSNALIAANITLGGLLLGLADSQYVSYIGYAGGVISDDVVSYGPFEVNQVSYAFGDPSAVGFSGVISLEDDSVDEGAPTVSDEYLVDVVGGLGYNFGTFAIKAVAGYDVSSEEGAVKVRADATLGAFTAFIMGGWNIDSGGIQDVSRFAPGTAYDGVNVIGWDDWALWAGVGTQFNEKLGANLQVAYTDSDVLAIAANLVWQPVPGLTVTPEVTYTDIDNVLIDDDQIAGMVRFERNF